MRDAWLDLLLGSSCAACGLPGRVLCPPCRRALPGAAYECWPTPTPPGLARPTAVGEYAGDLKLLVNAHKENGRFGLAGPLADLLAISVRAHLGGAVAGEPVRIVPVPSRAAVVRRRGHDPLLRISLRAAARLRAGGTPAVVLRVLRTVRATEDQTGLDAGARSRNLAGSMRCPRSPRVPAGARLVVVDDVVTTGSTLREAQRALEESGARVHGIAVVAATRRIVQTGGST